jgi:hypothetical protein
VNGHLEFIPVGHHNVGVELHAAFRKATEDTNNMIALEQSHAPSVPHSYAVMLFISAGRHVGGYPKVNIRKSREGVLAGGVTAFAETPPWLRG